MQFLQNFQYVYIFATFVNDCIHFQTLTFRQIQRRVTKSDSQPLADGSILVSVLGQLKTDEDPVNSYNQVFMLKPNAGSYYISNEIFRLVLHDM